MFGDITTNYAGIDASHEILVILIVTSLLGFVIGWICKPRREVFVLDRDVLEETYTQRKQHYSEEGVDLKNIEGIGPAIEKILHKVGIFSYSGVSSKTTEELKSILEEAGAKYAIHDPSSWPEQARMAEQGDWGDLKEFQEILGKKK